MKNTKKILWTLLIFSGLMFLSYLINMFLVENRGIWSFVGPLLSLMIAGWLLYGLLYLKKKEKRNNVEAVQIEEDAIVKDPSKLIRFFRIMAIVMIVINLINISLLRGGIGRFLQMFVWLAVVVWGTIVLRLNKKRKNSNENNSNEE